jgi:hypothetical protein
MDNNGQIWTNSWTKYTKRTIWTQKWPQKGHSTLNTHNMSIMDINEQTIGQKGQTWAKMDNNGQPLRVLSTFSYSIRAGFLLWH